MIANKLNTDWTSIKARIKAKFQKLTEENIELLKNNLDKLSEKLQSAYGYSKEEADKEFESFKVTLAETPLKESAVAKTQISKERIQNIVEGYPMIHNHSNSSRSKSPYLKFKISDALKNVENYDLMGKHGYKYGSEYLEIDPNKVS